MTSWRLRAFYGWYVVYAIGFVLMTTSGLAFYNLSVLLDAIQRVEQLSDAYHLTFGGEDVMIAYLLEVTRRSRHSAPSV